MPSRSFRLFLVWVSLLSCLCTLPARAELDTRKFTIVATNYPLAYFAERIAGSHARVLMPVPAGEDPAFWNPGAKAVAEMQKADLILLNGADAEKWLTRVSLPRLKLVDTSAAFKDELIRIENAVTHSHGSGGMHSHAGTANTTWIDFRLAGKQADAAARAMMQKRPEFKSTFEENAKALQADLAALDGELEQATKGRSSTPLLASHPVYQYLARRYGLKLAAVHWEPGEMPPAEEWAGLEELLKKHPAHAMLWEGQPSEETAAKLKGLAVDSVLFEPCANRPESGDFLTVMRANLANLRPWFAK